MKIQEYSSLPQTNIGWISMADHFIKTVGPDSGSGKNLGHILVLADATFAPESRFPMHPHQNLEILTWVVQGTLSHLDDQSPPLPVPEHHLQFMSARDGIYHAEGNAANAPMRLLQIWIAPHTQGGVPVIQYAGLKRSGFNLLAAPEGAEIVLRQNVWFYAAVIRSSEEFEVPKGKSAYAVSIGLLAWNGENITDGSGLSLDSGKYEIKGNGQAVIIVQ